MLLKIDKEHSVEKVGDYCKEMIGFQKKSKES